MAIDYFKIGQISGKQFTDVTGAVEKGLEAGFKPLVEWQKKRDKFDADYARLLQSTPNIDNLPELPSNYLPKASEWLISKQQEYAANARTTIKARPGSPEYQQAVMNMNNIKSSVANLKSNLTGINTERKEFLKSKETGEISLGFQNADIYEAYGPNGAITAIDANGNVALTGDGGKSFNWNERQEFFNKSGGVQKDLFVAGDISLKEGEAGKQRDIGYYTEKSKAIVAQYDLPKIKSLVFDDLDGTDTKLAEDAELVSLINSSTPNLPEIRQALANKLGGAMFDVNSNAFKKYSEKQAKALEAKQSLSGGRTLTNYDKQLLTIENNYNAQKNNISGALDSFLNSDKTLNQALATFGRLGLNVTETIEDDAGNIIGLKIKNSEVNEEITIPYSDPAAALIGVHNALGANKIGATVTLTDEFKKGEALESEIEQANMLLAVANSAPETEIPTKVYQTGIFKGRTGLEKAKGEARTKRQIEINSIMQARKRYNELAEKLGLQKVEFSEIK